MMMMMMMMKRSTLRTKDELVDIDRSSTKRRMIICKLASLSRSYSKKMSLILIVFRRYHLPNQMDVMKVEQESANNIDDKKRKKTPQTKPPPRKRLYPLRNRRGNNERSPEKKTLEKTTTFLPVVSVVVEPACHVPSLRDENLGVVFARETPLSADSLNGVEESSYPSGTLLSSDGGMDASISSESSSLLSPLGEQFASKIRKKNGEGEKRRSKVKTRTLPPDEIVICSEGASSTVGTMDSCPEMVATLLGTEIVHSTTSSSTTTTTTTNINNNNAFRWLGSPLMIDINGGCTYYSEFTLMETNCNSSTFRLDDFIEMKWSSNMHSIQFYDSSPPSTAETDCRSIDSYWSSMKTMQLSSPFCGQILSLWEEEEDVETSINYRKEHESRVQRKRMMGEFKFFIKPEDTSLGKKPFYAEMVIIASVY